MLFVLEGLSVDDDGGGEIPFFRGLRPSYIHFSRPAKSHRFLNDCCQIQVSADRDSTTEHARLV